MGDLVVRCKAKSKQTGEQCKNRPIRGGDLCRFHGGNIPKVKAKAEVVYEAKTWGFTDETIDPGEYLLRLVTQSAARAARYAAELEALVDSEGLTQALTGTVEVPSKYGSYIQGEYVRALAQLEAQERDRGANFATKAIAAGLAERQVRLAERQGELLATMVQAALQEAGLSDEQTRIVNASIGRQARELTP